MFSETDNLCMYHRFAKQKKIVFSLLRFWTREWGHSKVKDRTRESREERERERERERKRKRERKTICDQTKISLRHQFDIEKTASKEERKIKQRHFSIFDFSEIQFFVKCSWTYSWWWLLHNTSSNTVIASKIKT